MGRLLNENFFIEHGLKVTLDPKAMVVLINR